MKKLGILCMVFLLTLLTACSSTKKYSEEDLKKQYEVSFVETITPLKEMFSDKSGDNQTITNLLLTLSQTDWLLGEAKYSSSSINQWDSDYTIHTIFSDILNQKDNLPILFSGEVVTSYQNQMLYMMIKEFNLFMGQGNIEINFLNLLAKQLENKWIIMDNPEKSPIEVINTPQISEIIHWIQTAYTPSIPSQEQLLSLQKLFSSISELFDLSLSVDNLQIDETFPIKEERNFDKQISYKKEAQYLSDKQNFTNIFSYTPKQITFEVKNIIERETEINIQKEVVIKIFPKKNLNYEFIVTKHSENNKDIEIQGIANFKKQGDNFLIEIESTVNLEPITLENNQKIVIEIKGNSISSAYTWEQLILTGEIINLSEIL